MVNVNNKPVSIFEGTPLATLQETDVSDPDVAPPTADDHWPLSVGLRQPPVQPTTETDQQIDEIIAGLVSNVDPSIPVQYKEQLSALCQKY